MSGKRIALAEMIEQLREELSFAKVEGSGQGIRFEPLEVTVEAQVTVSREVEGKTGIKFWLAEAGVAGSAANSQTQKIVLKLRPVDAQGGKTLLGREL